MKSIITAIFICVAIGLKAQSKDSLRLMQIETKLLALEEKLFKADSLQYATKYIDTKEVFFALDDIQSDAINFGNALNKESFMLQIINVNNPTTLNLRNRILQEMQTLIETKVYDLLGKDSTKKRGLFNTIRNIFKNPIVNKLLGLVPLNNTITGIISTIGGIIMPEIEIKQNLVKSIVSKEIDIKTILDNSPLAEISNKILPYLQFYDTLYALNNRYSFLHQITKSKASEILNNINFLHPSIAANLNLKAYNTIDAKFEAFDKFLINYKTIKNNNNFNDEAIRKGNKMYDLILPVKTQANELKKLMEAYDWNFANFYNEYLSVLERYQNVNAVFSDMLKPIIENIKSINRPIINNKVSAEMFSLKLQEPITEAELQKRDNQQFLNKIEWKYKMYKSAKTEDIKKVVF